MSAVFDGPVTIVVDAAVSPDDFVGVVALRGPNGEAVIEDARAVKRPGRRTMGGSGSGLGVVRVPFSDDDARTPVASGRWTVTLGGATRAPGASKGTTRPWTGEARAVVSMQTTRDRTFRGGELDVDVYVPDGLEVGGARIDAGRAADDRYLAARLDGAFALVKRLYGVDRGDLRFHAAPASLRAIVGQEEIDGANRVADDPRPSAKLVLTNRLSPEGDGEISGVVNEIPGAIAVPGTNASAVIVSLREGSPVWVDASTIVHELGHFVGLEHTSELGVPASDALADTPVCAETTNKSALPTCADRNNLMFPTVNLASAEEAIWVSETQRALFLSSPLYRAKR